jgi:hypothetical protein
LLQAGLAVGHHPPVHLRVERFEPMRAIRPCERDRHRNAQRILHKFNKLQTRFKIQRLGQE